MTAPEFKRVEDRAVDEAVAAQEAAGLDVVTDGEMRDTRSSGTSSTRSTDSTSARDGRSRSGTTRDTRRNWIDRL